MIKITWTILLFVICQSVFSVRGNILYFLESVSSWEDLEHGYDEQFPKSPSLTQEEEEESRKAKADLVRFYLYTDLSTRTCPEELVLDDRAGLARTRFNKLYPVKFFIHGFGHNYNCSYPQQIKDLYLIRAYKVNIILVDWGALSMDSNSFDPAVAFRNYMVAVGNAGIVGRRVGEMINFLHQSRVTKLSKIHVVGFSLGAHVAGYAGEIVYQSWLERVSRITGLDPAGPLYYTGKVGRPLNMNDGNFVDTIHTDMGQAGTTRSIGHANFFVNSGYPPQPGCFSGVLRSEFFDRIPTALSGTCSHNLAPVYYAQSLLNTEPFIEARNCFAYMAYETGMCFLRQSVIFGEFCQPSIEGDFYVDLTPMKLPGLYKC